MNKMQCKVVTKGAHICTWQPEGEYPVLFCSTLADIEGHAAIRGGIPICWPWFGPKPGLPQHGFVRTALWNEQYTEERDDQLTMRYTLSSDVLTEKIWPGDWQLILDIRAGSQLMVSLTTLNSGESTMAITQALHTYFHLADIAQLTISGLQGKKYIDKVHDGKIFQQSSDLKFNGETDRIYLDTYTVQLRDDVYKRIIHVKSEGNSSMVVWNPWKHKCSLISDLLDDDYCRFVCVEAANAPTEIEIDPGNQHTLTMQIFTESM